MFLENEMESNETNVINIDSNLQYFNTIATSIMYQSIKIFCIIIQITDLLQVKRERN